MKGSANRALERANSLAANVASGIRKRKATNNTGYAQLDNPGFDDETLRSEDQGAYGGTDVECILQPGPSAMTDDDEMDMRMQIGVEATTSTPLANGKPKIYQRYDRGGYPIPGVWDDSDYIPPQDSWDPIVPTPADPGAFWLEDPVSSNTPTTSQQLYEFDTFDPYFVPPEYRARAGTMSEATTGDSEGDVLDMNNYLGAVEGPRRALSDVTGLVRNTNTQSTMKFTSTNLVKGVKVGGINMLGALQMDTLSGVQVFKLIWDMKHDWKLLKDLVKTRGPSITELYITKTSEPLITMPSRDYTHEVGKLCSQMPNLTVFYWDAPRQGLNDNVFHYLASMPNLHSVCLYTNKWKHREDEKIKSYPATNNVNKFLARRPNNSLQYLVIPYCLSVESCQEMIEHHASSMKNVCIGDGTSGEMRPLIEQSISFCTNVDSLMFRNCQMPYYSSGFPVYLHPIKSFKVENVEVTLTTFYQYFRGIFTPHLEELVINQRIEFNNIALLIASSCPNLRILRLSHGEIFNESLQAIFSRCPKLVEIHLSDVVHFTANAFLEIDRLLIHLVRLNLQNPADYRVADLELDRIRRSLTKKVEVTGTGCTSDDASAIRMASVPVGLEQ